MGRISCFLLILIFVTYVYSRTPPSAVIELNDKFLDVKNEGMWFVEFYAPWCAHCKRLHPIWDQVGHALADINLPIRVAKIDCTRFNNVASALNIGGYPTILFFRNGQRIDYRGSREKESLITFAKRSAAPIVEQINESRLQKIRLESRSEPSFLFYGKSKDSALFKEFSTAAHLMFSMARFYHIPETNSNQEQRERITVCKDNSEMEYDDKNIEDLQLWMGRERWPAFVAASSSNLAEIGIGGKLIVLVVSSDTEKFNNTSPVYKLHKIAEEAANEMKNDKDLWNRFQFAWLDGPDLASQIQMTNVKDPHLFVFNYTTYEYYLSEDDSSEMTKKSIITFLKQLADSIDQGTVISFGGRDILTRAKRMTFEFYWNIAQMFSTQPLLSSCIFGVPIAFLSIICYSICSVDFSVDRDEFYPEEEEELLDEESEADIDDDHEKAD